ncbi:hypothetical protein OG349_03310 [Streptomyces sp. NBC_01317]|uniref:hypothetical protein n=1 Tax=Streptomyces sp. NBC_01317 TaxID=2903822 RepID=UPI002E135EA6|nr:hypothetical protein OG349_03310 [Streptomyces sp. NBC_01317]
MRAIRAASAALLGATALALTAPTAVAAQRGAGLGFTVTPSTVAAGGRLTLAAPGCRSSGTASSAVFDTVTVPAGGTAAATVDWDAKRGATYRTTFTCRSGGTAAASFTVAGGATPTRTPTVRPTRTPAPVTTATSVAPGGVRGGLGGSVGGMNTAEILAGTALVVAAATGTIYAVRRRAENRGH